MNDKKHIATVGLGQALAMAAALGLGLGSGTPIMESMEREFREPPRRPARRPRSDVTHFTSERPLTKRQRRRLRGKRP